MFALVVVLAEVEVLSEVDVLTKSRCPPSQYKTLAVKAFMKDKYSAQARARRLMILPYSHHYDGSVVCKLVLAQQYGVLIIDEDGNMVGPIFYENQDKLHNH